ncbi:microtubule-actin cross-linking factor 1 isoform X17 [Engystomops pustulosus]|uniref:microtubule-actin cross-linking factor 1 isoform X17 n=1 Tax=Engystomops pustulosus TaxID=76066 RepID=UPI003AFA4734
MGNSVSCVRKPKEKRPGKEKEPQSGKKKRRFRRKKKDEGAKGEQEQMDEKEEEREEAKDISNNVCASIKEPEGISGIPQEEGRVLQVRETFHGMVHRAQLLNPITIPESPPLGTTVIARIVDNPADKKQPSLSTMVAFDWAGNSRAILLPIKGDVLDKSVCYRTSSCEQTNLGLSPKANDTTERSVPVTLSWGPELSSSGYGSEPLSQLEQISDIYVSGESGDMSAKEKLLLWTQKVTAGYVGVKCTNFTSCWSDGKMFNAIIHRYRPDLVDMQKVEIQSNRENLEQAFEIAESLGVTRLLDAEDVDVDSPDEKSVITYVSSIYDAFPKVPEGGEGISATEVDSRWLEYQERVMSLSQWIRQHVLLMSDKSFPQNPVELKALYNQYVHVKETEIPSKEQEKVHIQKLYQMLQPWIEFGRFKLSSSFHPNDVEEQWGKLILSMIEREKVLRPAVERLELLLHIANRIQNGCLSCEEKLTLARNTLQSDAANVECGQNTQQELEVLQFLQESEGLLRQLQADVQILRDEKYFQVDELAFRVLRIQDELLTLRLEYSNLYRKGNFISSDLQTSVSLNTSHQQGFQTSATSSTSWFRKPMSRAELLALSSSEDEGSLRFVYELLAWVEEMQLKLERAEWGTDLPSVETQLENQRQVHTSVEELSSSLREARSYEVKMSPNFHSSYRETLGKLEIQYCKLRETSSCRLRHLESLYNFVSRATAQIIWLNEKEEDELAYDWSDGNSNMELKTDYFSELRLELEQKHDVIQSLQETAELLSLENHPAKQTVEAYSAAVVSQWQWVQQLCLCVEQHLKENSAYFHFFRDVRESEVYLKNLQESIKRKYSSDRNTSMNRLEDMLQDSMEEKEQLIQSRSTVASLVGRSRNIVQLKPRNPEHSLSGTLPIRAVCDYRQIEITICRNEECVLEDNSQRTKWKVISTTGNEAMVPSVCFLIPPPNKEAIDMAVRVEQLYQKVMSLWHQLHVNTKSLISWHYVRKDLDLVQGWNMDKLRVLPLAERLQALSSLQSHLDDFLEDSKDSQIFSSTDRLNMEQEVEACKEQCRKLVDLIEAEDKDESLAQTYLSELHNIRLHLEDCEQRLVKRLQSPSGFDGDAIHENTIRISEQERMQDELKRLKSELSMVSERCDHFLHMSPSGSSTPNVRSQLDLLVGKMDQVYGLSSVFLEKLKTVDVVIRSLQSAEGLVKGFETRLSQEDTISADPVAIQSQQDLLQQWLNEAIEKGNVISTLEEDIAKSKDVKERLNQKTQERSLDLDQYQEKTAKLRERWSGVHTQLETRQSELATIREVLKGYRGHHDSLIQWIEATKSQQEMMKPGQSEDRRVLSEQLNEQTALVAEIERNQSRLDECQALSQQYSVSVKDYELQLMTYKAFVDSQQKSPLKRRRMLSTSDVITQEFMDLRTRYTALVTLTTQHVKYISDALRRLEEEEKVLEEEKEKHIEDLKQLSSWVSGLSQVVSGHGRNSADLNKSISEKKALNEELLSKKEKVSEAIKSMQIFLAKRGDKLSPEEKAEISSQIQALKGTYDGLCEESDNQIQELHTELAREAEQKESNTIAGVIDLGSMEVFPIFRAMQKGLIDQDTGFMLLEAQIVLSGLMIPETNKKVTLDEALHENIINLRIFQCLHDLSVATTLLEKHKEVKLKIQFLVTAIKEGKIVKSVGLKILNTYLASGILQISGNAKEPIQDMLVSSNLMEKTAISCKNFIDPNTAKGISLQELMQNCIIHESTGLRLIPVQQLAGGMVCLTSGKKVSVFKAVQEGLIDRQIAVRLLEAQLFAGGIVDPKTGHRLSLDEAVRYHLMDKDMACALLTRQLSDGGIIDVATDQRISLDEAVKCHLIGPKLALHVLESLGSLKGFLWPESGEVLPVSNTLQEGSVSTELSMKTLGNRHKIQGLYVVEKKEVMSWDRAIQGGFLDENNSKTLQSTLIPDIASSLSAESYQQPGGRSLSDSATSSTQPVDETIWEVLKNSQSEGKEKLVTSIRHLSYINFHNGQRLLLIKNSEKQKDKLFLEECENSFGGKSLDLKIYANKNNHDLKDTSDSEFKASLADINTDLKDMAGTSSSSSVGHPQTLETTSFQIQVQNAFKHNTMDNPMLEHTEDGALTKNNVIQPDLPGTSLSQVHAAFMANDNKPLDDSQTCFLAEAERLVNESDFQKPKLAIEKSLLEISIDGQYKNVNREQTVLKGIEHLKAMSKQDVVKVTKNCNIPQEMDASPNIAGDISFDMEEEDTLDMLSDQMRNGGILDANSHQKLLLNEAVAKGALSSHTALRLMERLELFSGFFDSQSCEELTIQDVIDEGLMDEDLLQKVFNSDKSVAGVVDMKNNQIYSVHEAMKAELIPEDIARSILEVQVITGGIHDVKRGKRISVTLASSLNLVNPPDKEELIKLEKASKGKSTDKRTKEKLLSLQLESSGITDAKSKKPLPLVEALKRGVVNRQDAILLLSKQIQEGGIIHHLSGIRFSVIDALKHGLIDQDLFEELSEFECLYHLHLSQPSEQGQRILSSNIGGIISSQLDLKPEDRVFPYTDILKKCKIEVLTGHRYVELDLLEKSSSELPSVSVDSKLDIPRSTSSSILEDQDIHTHSEDNYGQQGPQVSHRDVKQKAHSIHLDPNGQNIDNISSSFGENVTNIKKVPSKNKKSFDITKSRMKKDDGENANASGLNISFKESSISKKMPRLLSEKDSSDPELPKQSADLNGSSALCGETTKTSVSKSVDYKLNPTLGSPLKDAAVVQMSHAGDLEGSAVQEVASIRKNKSLSTEHSLFDSSGISEAQIDGGKSFISVSQNINPKSREHSSTLQSILPQIIQEQYTYSSGGSTQTSLPDLNVSQKNLNEKTLLAQLVKDQHLEHETDIKDAHGPSFVSPDKKLSIGKSVLQPLDSDSVHRANTSAVQHVSEQIEKTTNKKRNGKTLEHVGQKGDHKPKDQKCALESGKTPKINGQQSGVCQDVNIPFKVGEDGHLVKETDTTFSTLTKEPLKSSHDAYNKQACLQHEENLVCFLSVLRDIEVKLGSLQPVLPGLQDVQEKLRQAEVLDQELKNLESPAAKELDFVKCIVSAKPPHVPSQLLQALEKDAKNLEKSLNSIREISEARVKQLHSVFELEKGKVCAEHEELESKLQALLQRVKEISHSLDCQKTMDFRSVSTVSEEINILESLKQAMMDSRVDLEDIAYDVQFFISEQAQNLSPQQSRILLRLLNELQKSFRETSESLLAQSKALQFREHQTLQEQQVACAQELEGLSSWAEQVEKAVNEHHTSTSAQDLSSLQDQYQSMQKLNKDVHTRANQFLSAIKAAENFLEQNKNKMSPAELEAFQRRLKKAKEQYQAVLQKTGETEKKLESAVSTAVLEETKKSKTAEELKENLGKIESLLCQVLPSIPNKSNQKISVTDGKETGTKASSASGVPPEDPADIINALYERKKTQHEEMLAKQQNFILTIQSAQDFLDKHGSTLSPEERERLQKQLERLKEEYATSLSQSQLQLKHSQSLRDDLQNFIHDCGEFENWLHQSEKELHNMQNGEAEFAALHDLLHRQGDFSEDVISHKGDLRYITIAGQKVIDAEKSAAEQCNEDSEVQVAGALVKNKLEDASKRYSALHSKCSKLGTHLNSLLSWYQQFQEGSDAVISWLQNAESSVEKLLSEPVASDPMALQSQLEKAKSMQCEIAEHQVHVEKVHKAVRGFHEMKGDPLPNCKKIQTIADSIESRFQTLSSKMSSHSDLLQKSVAQSQSVQEGLEHLLHWLEGIEMTLERQKQSPMSSSAIQEALAQDMKLRQDIGSRRGSLDATGEMVVKFMETADKAAAATLQKKLSQVTARFDSVCQQQSLQETALKEVLPKVERYEQISEALQDFIATRSQLLASGNQPDRDISQFSEQIQELNIEIKQQDEQLDTLEHLVKDLSTCPLLLNASEHLQKVQTLKKAFQDLQEAASDRQQEAMSCQEELEEFRSLVGSMRKWLKDSEDRIPSCDVSYGSLELQILLQQVQDLLKDWKLKGPQVEIITHKGSQLENRIMQITSSESQLQRGSVQMASMSTVGNVNGYHTCQDLTGIQCDVSEISQMYEDLGVVLKNHDERLSAMLEKMQKVQQETNDMLKWLESKEKVITAVNVSPTKSEIVRAQAQQNKEFIFELEQSSEKVQKLKGELKALLEEHPNSPEAESWRQMLENLNERWDRTNQVSSERQLKLEESANQLATFQTAASQLRPWLTEKELMMSVLGPLSIDPNMLSAQKQQVQFMLKEFEARKAQYEELKHAAYGILTGPGDESPSTSQVEDDFHEISQKWTELTNRLNSRADHIDQAAVKSTQYQEVLQGLTDKIKETAKKLGAQPAVSTQPDAVKHQLQETSGIRSELEDLAQEVASAQVLCSELSALVAEPYLKDELQKRLDTVALPLKGMEDLAADRVNRLQTALASSQQFQQMFDELRNWLEEKQMQQSKSKPISCKLDKLQSLLQEQEEFQKTLNQNSGSYEMIVAEGESLLLSSQPGEEKTALQNQLASLKSNWEELGKRTSERLGKLKDCSNKAQKYKRHVEDLVPCLEDCENQLNEMQVTLNPMQLDAQLLRAKVLQSEIDKKRSLLEMVNSTADLLTEAAEADEQEILEEKAQLNQRMDSVTEQLHDKAGSIEEMSLRFKELNDSFKNIDKKLEGAKHHLEIYAALGSQACSNKNLENMKSQQEMLQNLDTQVQYLKNLIQGLTEDAPKGSDVSSLLRQAEDVQNDFDTVKQEVNECCLNMEQKLQGIGQFHAHVREIFSSLTDLDDELDNMGPVGRDVDSLRSQTEVMQKFLETVQSLKSDVDFSEKKCRVMLENEGGPDLIALMRELGTLNKQCMKLTERGKNRQEQLEATLGRIADFNVKLKELKHQISTAEGSSALQEVVGTEVEVIKQQLQDFKVFQKDKVDSLQVKLQQVNGIGQGLIQSADKNCDVHGLEHDIEELNSKWNLINKKVAERVTQLQEALLHCGKFQDALEPLLSWLTDTEDLIENQKPPSAEYKVVKAQIQEQKLLQRLLDDRRSTMDMIQVEGTRIAEGADPADGEKINCQLETLKDRWSSLLQKAQSRQKQLDDILVLAKQFHETTEPIFDWLSATEKKLANSEPIGTQTGKIQQQIIRHKSLEDDVAVHETDVCQAGRLVDSLSVLCCAAERNRLAQKLDFLHARYREVQDLCSRKGALLGQALSNARLFGEDEVEVLNWLAEVEDKLSSVSVKDYKLDVLQNQHKNQMALSEEIINRKRNVDQAVKNGQALLKQTTGEEVLLIQEKLDGIKTRYAEITASSGKALRTLEQALQLASKFQTTHEELTSWLARVEDELAHTNGQSTAGDQIPQFQQRQKELKKEAMEYRIVLDTINEVGSALLELVPWRAREGLDKLVSEANEQYRSVSATIGQRVDQIDAAIQRSQQASANVSVCKCDMCSWDMCFRTTCFLFLVLCLIVLVASSFVSVMSEEVYKLI